jgi:hypothetical protein
MLKRVVFATVGLVLAGALGFFLYTNYGSSSVCDVCHRPLQSETYYRIHMADGTAMNVCCPRCGLRFQHGRTDVASTEVTDFASKKLFPADEAFYVEGSPVHFCSHAPMEEDRSGTQYEVAWDRCLPSLIAFESRDAAVEFERENGGVVKTYAELLEEDPP